MHKQLCRRYVRGGKSFERAGDSCQGEPGPWAAKQARSKPSVSMHNRRTSSVEARKPLTILVISKKQ